LFQRLVVYSITYKQTKKKQNLLSTSILKSQVQVRVQVLRIQVAYEYKCKYLDLVLDSGVQLEYNVQVQVPSTSYTALAIIKPSLNIFFLIEYIVSVMKCSGEVNEDERTSPGDVEVTVEVNTDAVGTGVWMTIFAPVTILSKTALQQLQ